MTGISIEIPEEDVDEIIYALDWWGGERMKNIRDTLLLAIIDKVDNED